MTTAQHDISLSPLPFKEFLNTTVEYQQVKSYLSMQKNFGDMLQDDSKRQGIDPTYLCLYLLESIDIPFPAEEELLMQFVQFTFEYILKNANDAALLVMLASQIHNQLKKCRPMIKLCKLLLDSIQDCQISQKDTLLLNYISHKKKEIVHNALDSEALSRIVGELKTLLPAVRSPDAMRLKERVTDLRKVGKRPWNKGKNKKADSIEATIANLSLADRKKIPLTAEILQAHTSSSITKIREKGAEKKQWMLSKIKKQSSTTSLLSQSSSVLITSPSNQSESESPPIMGKASTITIDESDVPEYYPSSPSETSYFSADEKEHFTPTLGTLELFSLEVPPEETSDSEMQSYGP